VACEACGATELAALLALRLRLHGTARSGARANNLPPPAYQALVVCVRRHPGRRGKDEAGEEADSKLEEHRAQAQSTKLQTGMSYSRCESRRPHQGLPVQPSCAPAPHLQLSAAASLCLAGQGSSSEHPPATRPACRPGCFPRSATTGGSQANQGLPQMRELHCRPGWQPGTAHLLDGLQHARHQRRQEQQPYLVVEWGPPRHGRRHALWHLLVKQAPALPLRHRRAAAARSGAGRRGPPAT
jgi:hypothetical protein